MENFLKLTVWGLLPECNNNESPATQLCSLLERHLELLGKFSSVFHLAGQQCEVSKIDGELSDIFYQTLLLSDQHSKSSI